MNSAHNYKKPESDEDPLTLMLTKTGCIDLHYKVQVSYDISSILSRFSIEILLGVYC